jgi:two-component system NtrC family sensor kinase
VAVTLISFSETDDGEYMPNDTSPYRRLLIIDDNEAIHGDFKKTFALGDLGNDLSDLDAEIFGEASKVDSGLSEFLLEFASQGKEGLELLKSSQQRGLCYGAAFVDMRMPPGWDGVETIENLWKIDPDLQVVICTAYSDRSWAEVFDRLGRTDKILVLKKPFDEIEVIQFANSLSEKRRLLEQSKLLISELRNVVQARETELVDAHKDSDVLIDSLSNVLVNVDEQWIVSRWNHVAAGLFGIQPLDAIGKKLQELPIAWTDWSIIETALSNSFVKQTKPFEVKFVDSSGAAKTLETTACPILHEATPNARLILGTDVTLQKSMQSQLDQALRMESVGQLAAGVAHEINTPMQYIGDNVRFVSKSLEKLAPILECLHLLVDPEVSDEQLIELRKTIPETIKPSKVKSSLKEIPEALSDSIEGVVAVSKIVAAMKEFSHPGTDEKSQVCVNHILASTITVAKNEWKYVADVETDFEADLIKIDGLPSELNQAFLNIIVNAAHAIGDRITSKEMLKGLIRISTRSAGNRVLATIQDNGGGIPGHARGKVFEPFFTTKGVGKGTGQGLAIAYRVLVQKHGGKISFNVEEGVGTTFNIELPKDAVEVIAERDLNATESITRIS